MTDGETAGDILAEGAEMPAHALADRLERLETGGAPGRMDADAFRRMMIDGDKHRDLTVADDGGVVIVGAPHCVDGFGDDRAVMIAWSTRCDGARRRERAGLKPSAARPAGGGGANPGAAQPHPDLAIAFAMKRAGSEHIADRLQKLHPAWRRRAPRATALSRLAATAVGSAAPWQPPDAADPRHPIRCAGGRRDTLAHGFRLRRAKGRFVVVVF